MGILSRAIGGFAAAGAQIATDELENLRRQRLMELEHGWQQARDDKNQLREDARYSDEKAFREKSFNSQAENMKAENAARNKQLEISQKHLDLDASDREFAKVSSAYDRSLADVNQLHNDLQKYLTVKGTIDPTTGLPVDNAKIENAIIDTQNRIDLARREAVKNLRIIKQNFPNQSKYIPSLADEPQPQQPADFMNSPLQSKPLIFRPGYKGQ